MQVSVCQGCSPFMVGSGTRARKYRQSETKLQVGRSYAAGQGVGTKARKCRQQSETEVQLGPRSLGLHSAQSRKGDKKI